jgi:tRNA pseudouridine13 synthase
MKDKHAVTVQWLSLPRRSAPPSLWKLPENVRVLEESYHNNKLRTGHLHGNRFVVRLVDIVPDAEERIVPLLDILQKGLLNAFGEQRFGHGGSNIDQALAWLHDPRSLRGRRARFLAKLYPSVLQSELFNRYLSARLRLGLGQLLLGEVVRLEGSGSNFVVKDLQAKQPRYESGNLHPQGPMFGPKMRAAEDQALELETAVLGELGLAPELLETLGSHAPGTRRDVHLFVKELEWNFERDDAGALSLVLAFALPAGSYATQVVRELCHTPWFPQKPPTSAATPADEPESSDEEE